MGESKLDTWSDGWRHLKLIVLLAPDIFLIGPGLTLALAGVIALVLGFLDPSGVEVGSARWQPVFFSGVALVLGLQMFFAGTIVAASSPLSRSRRTPYRFVRDPLWPRRAVVVGLAIAAVGVLIDAALFVWWVFGSHAPPMQGTRFALASLAQTLMILGGSFAVYGVVLRFARGLERAPSRSTPTVGARAPLNA